MPRMISSTAFAFFSVIISAQALELGSPTHRAHIVDAFTTPGRLSPRFENGLLISLLDQSLSASTPNVFLYGQNGQAVKQITVWPEGASKVSLFDASITPDGTLATVGAAIDRDGRYAAFLGIADTHNSIIYVRANPFSLHKVTFASDGTIWATASRMDEGGGDDANAGDYFVLRHFARSGKMLHEALARSSLKGLLPASDVGGEGKTVLTCNGKRVGLLVGTSHRWIEIDSTGGIVGDWTFTVASAKASDGRPLGRPKAIGGLVYLPTGDVIALLQDEYETGLYSLDRIGGTWNVVGQSASTLDIPNGVTDLVGRDGNNVVYRGPATGVDQLVWSPIK